MDYIKRQELIRKIADAENLLDEINNYYGDRHEYCMFCGSVTCDSVKGIVHQHFCVISQLKSKMRLLNRVKKDE